MVGCTTRHTPMPPSELTFELRGTEWSLGGTGTMLAAIGTRFSTTSTSPTTGDRLRQIGSVTGQQCLRCHTRHSAAWRAGASGRSAELRMSTHRELCTVDSTGLGPERR